MRYWVSFFAITIFTSSLALAQAPDTVFIRQDHDFDDTLIYSTDTVIFESGMTKQILIGTTIMSSTHNQMMARGYGLYLDKVTKSDCQGEIYEKKGRVDKINSIENTDSTLVIDINITENCCNEFLCDILVDSAGVLNLIYYGYGSYCDCECCFGLTFHFVKQSNSDYSKVKSVMLYNKPNTITKIKK